MSGLELASAAAGRLILSGVSPCPLAIGGLKCTSARAHDGCPASVDVESEMNRRNKSLHLTRSAQTELEDGPSR